MQTTLYLGPLNDLGEGMPQAIGSLIMDLQGTILNQLEAEMLAQPLVGGVILFTRNYVNRAQLIALCQSIRQARTTPLLILIDQEGGRVQRLKNEFTRLPALAKLGALQKETALTLAHDCGWLMASELLAVGIDMSLAPVLDLYSDESTVIGDRAFHRDPMIVSELAMSYMQGMRAAGMAATGKHFPGHGSVTADSHQSMPIDPRSYAQIVAQDLIPFKSLIDAGIEAMMPAHIQFPEIDSNPVGYSAVWLKNILREELHFNGCIISDDLNMEGANINSDYAARVHQAHAAGCDFFLLCNNRTAVEHVLAEVNPISVPFERWQCLAGRPSVEQASHAQKINAIQSQLATLT